MNTIVNRERDKSAAELELDVPFRTRSDDKGSADDKYELLARLAVNYKSLQKAIETELFRKGWQQRLGILRRTQRAAGYPDEEFLHSKRKRERGMHVAIGRRRTNGK